MLRLYIMRHAKSSWAIPGARDFDRELNDRGISDCVKIGKSLSSKGYSPDLILCSSATRTRETLDNILDYLDPEPEIRFTEKLYSSGLSDYIELLQELGEHPSVLIIGHNPMCGSLAASMPGSGNEESIAAIAYKYPTATVSVIDFDFTNWSEIQQRSGIMIEALIPSQL